MLDFIPEFFYKAIISFVGLVYGLVSYVYEVFLCLAQKNIFEQDIYRNIADKIYVILGVVMLFVIAYNLLTLVIDPDKNSKGQSIEKLLKSLVSSIILIIICPSLFNFAFRLQSSILLTNGGVINNLFADDVQDRSGEDTIKMGGKIMALDTFKAFFTPEDNNYSIKNKSDGKEYTLEDGSKISCKGKNSCTLTDAEKAAYDSGTFNPYKGFAMNIVKDEIDFNWILALIAGGYLVYVIVSFCFDLAVRACKLALYQILAPICISCRALPKKESIFNNWLKAIKNTFLSVFIRIFIMNLGVLIIVAFRRSNFWDACEGCSPLVPTIGNAFIILGIVTFIKQAPKLVDEIFNFGDIKLGIREKLSEGGAMAIGAAIGGGITSAALAFTNHRKKIKEINKNPAKTGDEKISERWQQRFRGARSVLAGTVSGAVRGASGGSNVKTFKDMANAAGQAAQDAAAARSRREERNERYHARQSEGEILKDGVVNVKNIAKGHIKDVWADVKDWATGGATPYEGIIKLSDQYKRAQDSIDSVTDELLKKHKNNSKFVADMTEFKGDTNHKQMEYYLKYRAADASLGAIENDIESLRKVNSLEEKAKILGISINERDYADHASFQAAMDSIGPKFAQMLTDLDSMYSQLMKQSRKNVQARVIKSKTFTEADWIDEKNNYGISEEEYEPIRAKQEEFRVLHESHGNRIVDPITGKHYEGPLDSIDMYDNVGSAAKNMGERARYESARIRQQHEMRQSQSGHGNGNGH